MQKFLSIPVTGEQNQLVSCNDIKIVEIGDASGPGSNPTTATTIYYGGGKKITLTHAAVSGGSEEMRDAVQDGVVEILQKQWTDVALQMDSLPQAVSGIAIS